MNRKIENRKSSKDLLTNRLLSYTNTLILNGRFIDNLGLGNGKMGIAIFFYNYAQYTNQKEFEEFADDLVDEISKDLSSDTSLDFENGLTGIGWGIEYLVRNRFIEGDTDIILSDIDYRLSEHFNGFAFDERLKESTESGYIIYQQARNNDTECINGKLFSFINPQIKKNEPLGISVLIDPGNYGLFHGIAGNALLTLKKLNTKMT